MPHETLRDVLAVLEQRGRLRRIAKPVDVGWEPGCFVKWAFQALPEQDRFGLWFENVVGHDMPVVTGAPVWMSAIPYASAETTLKS